MSICPVVLSANLELDLLDRDSIAASSLRRSFVKKLTGDKISEAARSAAISLFMRMNKRCAAWQLNPETLLDEYLLGSVREKFYRSVLPILDMLDPVSILRRGRHGPGSSSGVSGTDAYSKSYSGALTATSEGLSIMYKSWCKSDLRRAYAEMARSEAYGSCTILKGSRIEVVPKNRDVGRTICVEPSLNMYFQLGLGAILEDALMASYGISLSHQPALNKRLARIGSRTGSFSTIDLSSASDTISLEMVRWLVPRELLNWLLLLRSPTTEVEGKTVELNLLSSMGNGYTFPLQTLIFAAVVAAVYDLHPLPLVRAREVQVRCSQVSLPDLRVTRASKWRLGNFGVFGDDIIVRTESDAKVRRLLHLLGFVVNSEKSFCTGDFRESCGGDYHRGKDVRGVYIKSLSTLQDCLSAFNALTAWSAKHRIPLVNTLRYLLCFTGRFRPVPLGSGFTEGHIVPSSLARITPRQGRYQCMDFRYTYWTPTSSKVRFSECTVSHPDRRRRIYNHDGVLLVALGGYLRQGCILIRPQGLMRYTLEARASSTWDGPPALSGWCARLTSVLQEVLM